MKIRLCSSKFGRVMNVYLLISIICSKGSFSWLSWC